MGTVKPIRFNAGDASGLDELAGAGRLINALVDKADCVRARPGVEAWADFPTPTDTSAITGMIPAFGGLVFTTAGENIFVWRTSGQVLDLSNGVSTRKLAGTARPSFALGRNMLIIANGAEPQKVDNGLASARLGGSPPDFSEVVITSRRVIGLAANDSGLIYWSDAGETALETYDTGNEFREAESRADPAIALRESKRELFVFGTETTQVFYPDEIETFTPTATIDVGCSARQSVVRYEDEFAWLDDKGRFVMSNGRQVTEESVISSPFITRTLEDLSTVSDCWSYRQRIGPHDLLVWTFPTDGRAFAFDMTTRLWAEFLGFTDGNYSPYLPTSYVYWPGYKLHLVGMPDGTIAKLSLDAHTDRGDVLKCTARTGFNDYGESRHKDPLVATFVFRRGEAASASSSVYVRWRDDLGGYCQPIKMPLGTAGETNDPAVEVRPAGQPYRQREYELEWTADEAFLMAKAYEEFEVRKL